MSVKIIMKCTGCKKVKELSQQERDKAKENGCVMCDECFMPMVVKSAGGIL